MHDEGTYEILVLGRLGDRWIDWLAPGVSLEGAREDVVADKAGERGEITRLVGRFDQSGLHGLLRRLSDLGVVLISLKRLQ